MTSIRKQWQQAACDFIQRQKSLPINIAHYYSTAFAVTVQELPLLCLLEAEDHITISELPVHVQEQLPPGLLNKIITDLRWLDWIAPELGANNLVYLKTQQYQLRMQLWEQQQWTAEPGEFQRGYPAEEDMLFPMKKEVYEDKLERISDDMQGLQMNYAVGEWFIEELDEVDKEIMKKERATIEGLKALYDQWRAYVPKYLKT